MSTLMGLTSTTAASKARPNKWLDLAALCHALLPPNKIQHIRYFTAKVSAHTDLHQPVRQSTYLRALQTILGLSVHLGHFLTSVTRMPLVNPVPGGPRTVEVIKTEKGSDVNLTTYLLVDAFRADADTFVVVSNDSDSTEPIRLIRQELGYRVGIMNPHQMISRALQRTRPSFTKQIRPGVLAASQFPEKLNDAHGTITKPTTW